MPSPAPPPLVQMRDARRISLTIPKLVEHTSRQAVRAEIYTRHGGLSCNHEQHRYDACC